MLKLIKILQQGKPTFPCIFEEAAVKNGELVGLGKFEWVDSLIRGAAKYYHFYIVDTEAEIHKNYIVLKGDGDVWGYEVRKMFWDFNSKQLSATPIWNKIIASTDISLGLPTLHPETVQRYCDNLQLEIANVSYNVGKIADDKWLNFTNADSLEKAKELCQQGFDTVRLMVFWKEPFDNESEPQVDFDLLKDFIDNHLVTSSHSKDYIAKLSNVKLFFQQITTSKEFAILAHKELSK